MDRGSASSGTARRARIATALGVMAASWMMLGAPASAGSLDGCSGSAQSKDADGAVIDSATAANGNVNDADGGESFSASNPFLVDNEGSVDYSGKTDAVITNHKWSVKIMGIEVASGGSANSNGEQEDSDTFDTGDELPVKITGLVKVEGEIAGDGGTCTGSGYVKVEGNPLASPLTWAGIVLGVIGALGLAKAMPKVRPVKGALQ